jgi:hypothetical protein
VNVGFRGQSGRSTHDAKESAYSHKATFKLSTSNTNSKYRLEITKYFFLATHKK